MILYLVWGTNHEDVTNVNNECILRWWNGVPFVVGEDFKATDLVLVEDGQACWITMRPCAKGHAALFAYWVAIQSHYGGSILKKLAKM